MATIFPTMSLVHKAPAPVPAAASVAVAVGSAAADAEARELAAAVGRGDEAAFRRLYDLFQPRLLRLALVLGHGNESLAQDAVQAAFIQAAGKLRSAENEAHLWNWLARVTRQQISKTRRQQQRQEVSVDAADLTVRDTGPEASATLEASLDAALMELDSEERRLIEGFYFDRRTHKQLGDKLGLTAKAVSCRLERARKKLRLLVTRSLPDER